MNLQNFLNKLTHRIFSLLVLITTLTGATLALAQERYIFSDDRKEVKDTRTGLTWERCSQGQAFEFEKDYCTGTASYHTHEQALVLAKDKVGWRLPNVKELSSLVDVSQQKPTIDEKYFPGTLPYAYWSSTPFVADSSMAWIVYFSDGYVLSLSRGNYFHVRLVRM